ncbi:AbrB/MazE/SpoVT family DNA-binding domain-containing protein [Candidatus Bathyarchaeota archaeon]|nr:AbrB/MazE/SpoVT family DNA-binding domain-containing protein [Candidatus Bathyarchaeota archaeon]
MSLAVEAYVGKKYAIYLPKAIVKALGIREGCKVLLRVSGGILVLEVVRDPVELALSGRKFASISPGQIEAISLEEQAKYVEGSP